MERQIFILSTFEFETGKSGEFSAGRFQKENGGDTEVEGPN